MNLTPMRFKTFVWPHNPRTYTITFKRELANFKVPFGRYYLQNLGLTRRVLKGEGEFVGEGAYDKFKELACLFYEESAGVLVHPVWMTTTAWFAGLELKQEPRSDYVSYSFEFWEVNPPMTSKLTETELRGTVGEEIGSESLAVNQQTYHTVVSGDTLWDIANTYEVSLPQIIDWNPQIKNPNLIYPGEKVRVG